MKRFGPLWFYLILLLPVNLWANDGSLSVYVFFDGKPLANIEIIVDGKTTYQTDSDGSSKIYLESGQHQVEIYGTIDNKQYLGYIKKPIEIKDGKNTQLVARFISDDDNRVEIDTPLEGRELKVDK
jgi:hypothetical protein